MTNGVKFLDKVRWCRGRDVSVFVQHSSVNIYQYLCPITVMVTQLRHNTQSESDNINKTWTTIGHKPPTVVKPLSQSKCIFQLQH